ncbi:MAG: hypothetical protein KAV87_55485 [Desulfobacteraceae bacterium]|nr:hypothetical protein [Desulfobacteraceae bacterium]
MARGNHKREAFIDLRSMILEELGWKDVKREDVTAKWAGVLALLYFDMESTHKIDCLTGLSQITVLNDLKMFNIKRLPRGGDRRVKVITDNGLLITDLVKMTTLNYNKVHYRLFRVKPPMKADEILKRWGN